jgi:hypothetical protein
MRYLSVFIFFATGITLILCAAFQDSCMLDISPPNAGGEELYTRHCLSCHGPEGHASILYKDTLSRSQWESFFTAGNHLGQDLNDMVDTDTLQKIRSFCLGS